MEKYSLKQEETVHGFLSDHLGQCFSACVNQRATQPLKAKQKPYQAVVSLWCEPPAEMKNQPDHQMFSFSSISPALLAHLDAWVLYYLSWILG